MQAHCCEGDAEHQQLAEEGYAIISTAAEAVDCSDITQQWECRRKRSWNQCDNMMIAAAAVAACRLIAVKGMPSSSSLRRNAMPTSALLPQQ
jgi:hypothetical protein